MQSGGPAAKKPRTEDGSGKLDIEKCFVCDTSIVGKKYSLASCMTNGTKVRLVEVLGRLVSDSHMVVVSSEEFICRGCANLLNTLDRLEAEITSVKRIVLNFVERKYNLGEQLQSQLTPAPVVYSKNVPVLPPTVANRPQIATPSTSNISNKTYLSTPVKKKATPLAKTQTMQAKTYQITLKDDQVLGKSPNLLQNAEKLVLLNTGTEKNKLTPTRSVWMQCNQCQYTTNQRGVMLNHLREHVANRGKAATATTTTTSSGVTTSTKTTTTTSSGITTTAKTTTQSAASTSKMMTLPTLVNGTPTTSAKGDSTSKNTITPSKSGSQSKDEVVVKEEKAKTAVEKTPSDPTTTESSADPLATDSNFSMPSLVDEL